MLLLYQLHLITYTLYPILTQTSSISSQLITIWSIFRNHILCIYLYKFPHKSERLQLSDIIVQAFFLSDKHGGLSGVHEIQA